MKSTKKKKEKRKKKKKKHFMPASNPIVVARIVLFRQDTFFLINPD